MPHYLYRIQPTRPGMLTEGATDDEREIIAAHIAYLEELAEQGTVLLAGRTQNTDPTSFGIVILSAGDDAEAAAIVAGDPAVAGGVMAAELFPYRIAVRGDPLPWM